MRYKKFYSHLFLTTVAMLGTLTSCSNNEGISLESGDDSSELTCVARDFELGDNFSRSSLTFDSKKGMVFAWTEGDEMTVFGKDDFRATQLYKLESGIGEPLAKFYAESFRLKPGLMYYAFSKTERTNGHVSTPDQNNITVDYSGQTQTGNANTSHLGDYDFMAAGTLCKDENAAHFTFDHLGSVLRFVMSFDLSSIIGDEQNALLATGENATRFTKMEIYDSENSFRQTKRDFKFSAGASGDSYTFAWPEQEITDMDRFTLTLQSDSKDGVSLSDAIKDGSGSNEQPTDKNYRKLITYMEVPPMDFTGKKLGVMLKGYYLKNGNPVDVSYVGVYDKDNFVIKNGKAYQLSLSMKKPDDFNVTLKINHMWQHGNTLDQSRGTGDPGNDDDIVTPKYIYYIYCHDGKVIKPTTATGAQALTTISGLETTNWDTKNNNGVWISTYKGNGGDDNGIIKLQKPTCSNTKPGHSCSYHLYVVASQTALTLSGISEDVSEKTVIRELKYNLPSTGVQTFMRDLYSTPWDATSFVGNITDPMQDVTLYHVAAKVDLKWNSTSAIENVSVNNVKKENLYIFKPTENTDGITTSDGYTETSNLTDNVDQWYNGRYVFYLPQFTNNCTYKVKLGSNEAENITFTPATTGGFTSWLRWLKKN